MMIMELTLSISILIGFYILSVGLLSYWRRSDSKHALYAKKSPGNNLKCSSQVRTKNYHGQKY